MSMLHQARRIGLLVGALLMLLVPSQGRATEQAGLLWPAEEMAPAGPPALVVVLHDPLGIDSRGWTYAEQLTAAGITVLHVELLDVSADGYTAGPAAADLASQDAAQARARLVEVIDTLAEDPRFDGAPIGLLAFGESGAAALHVATDPQRGRRVEALALLYPGCAGLIGPAAAQRSLSRAPVLLLHGDADPANSPAECGALAEVLAAAGPVRRREFAGAGYAWDRPPHGPYEMMKLPWPGRPGLLLPVHHWPALTELAAAQVAAFFASSLAPPHPLQIGGHR
jgi:dienelactone hydrolase